jgi:hypothetical protein
MLHAADLPDRISPSADIGERLTFLNAERSTLE